MILKHGIKAIATTNPDFISLQSKIVNVKCTKVKRNMLDEINPRLEKLAEEPYETNRKYELKIKKIGGIDWEILIKIR